MPDRLPVPGATAYLYRSLCKEGAEGHPAYLMSKMVAWHEGWKRAKDFAFKSAMGALNRDELRHVAERVRARREAWLAPLERTGLARRLFLTARTDAMVWLVSAGPLELGLALHHTYGFPFLPGSSLKGLARRVARGENGTTAKGKYGSQEAAAAITILDGLPCSGWKVQRDVMTPHFGCWYQGGRTLPDDTENPVPIPFLSIAAGSGFEIALLARDAGAAAMLDAVTEDLRQGLDELGLGAKTAAGYGVFGVEVVQYRQAAPVEMPAPDAASVSENAPPGAQPPSAPRRDPRVVEAETLIRSLKEHEVKPQLQAVAAAIRGCPAGERDALVSLFREHQGALHLKAKDIRLNMESLARQVKSPDPIIGA